MSRPGAPSAIRRVLGWWCLVAILVGIYVGRNVVAVSARVESAPSDFDHYHRAAQAVLNGASPYGVRGFLYPPPALLPVLPFAVLDAADARLGWLWFSHVLILAAGIGTWWRLGGDRRSAIVVVAVWSLTGTVAENLVLGQINPLLLALLTSAMIVSVGWESWSATIVATAAAIKIWPGLLLVHPLMNRRWRAFGFGFGWAVTLLLGTFLLSTLLLPPPHHPSGTGSWSGSPAFLNLSLPATTLRLIQRPTDWRVMPPSWIEGNRLEDVKLEPGAGLASLATSVVILVLCGLVFRKYLRRDLPAVAVLAALVAIAFAASPVSWYHYRLVHLPGLAWLASALLARRDSKGLVLLGALVVVVTWSHGAWLEPVGLIVEPWFVVARGLLVPTLELVLAGWYLKMGSSLGNFCNEAGG